MEGHDAVAGGGHRDGLRELRLVRRVLLLALAEYDCQLRLVNGLRLLVLVANDGRGRRRAWLHIAHVAPALLLVLEREPYLPFERVARVDGVESLLRCQLPPPVTHLLYVHPPRPQHVRHRDPLRFQMLVVGEGHI
ncbi:hypothetical protein D1007_44818 [Hordeum vulgare]|nr:hypothetical protein D1007_44818 [Hordeum vulgare]